MHRHSAARRRAPLVAAEPRKPRSNGFGGALCLLLLLPACFLACPPGAPPSSSSSPPPQVTATGTTTAALPRTTAFDGERAFAHVKRQVEFGPRPAGSPALKQTRDYLVKELESAGLTIRKEEFQAATPAGPKSMVNLTAELPGESADVIMIASHYDTKPFKEFRFVGANDGASSTGALLELARALAAGRTSRPKYTYWFVLFDGEEAFCREWDECSTPAAPDHTYGSRHYAAQLAARGELKRVRAMILLDMIGYRDLEMGRDDMGTRWLLDIIWGTARELGYTKQFADRAEGVGGDDHEPFLRAGVEAVDLIQLGSYPYWHTAEDTLDKISPRSLKIVGDVVLASLPRIEERLAKRGT